MGKITVKHYLNTKAKPVFINGEKHYKIKILGTVNRYTFRIDSLAFSEHYTEAKYNEICLTKEKDFDSEAITVQNLIDSQLKATEMEFDFMLFNLVYKTMPKHAIFPLSPNDIYEMSIHDLISNAIPNLLSEEIIKRAITTKPFTYLDFFTPKTQEIIIKDNVNNDILFMQEEKEAYHKFAKKVMEAVFCYYFDIVIKPISISIEKYDSLFRYFPILKKEDAFDMLVQSR